jgi:hypothetical protein
MRRGVVVLLAVTVTSFAAACGGGGDDEGDAPPATLLQLRPVIDADVAPCTAPAVALDQECLTLGPSELDARNIETVTDASGAGGPAIDLHLSSAGIIQYNKAAADSGLRRVGVLVDGVLVAAPAVQGIPLEQDVVVAGHFTAQQIATLTKAFQG